MTKKGLSEQNQKFRDFVTSEVLNKYPRKELLYRLNITESALNYWLACKVNVTNIPLSTWLRLSSVSGYSLDEMFKKIDIHPSEKDIISLRTTYSSQRFKRLIKDLLIGNKQTELAEILDTNGATISKWASHGNFKPENISGSIFAKIAAIKGISVEELMVWLGVKVEKVPLASLSQVQETVLSLSKREQAELASWLIEIIFSGISDAE